MVERLFPRELDVRLAVYGSAAWIEFVHVNRNNHTSRVLSLDEVTTLGDAEGALFANGAALDYLVNRVDTFESESQDTIRQHGAFGRLGNVRVFSDVLFQTDLRWLPRLADATRPLFWFFEAPVEAVATPDDWCVDPDCDCGLEFDDEVAGEGCATDDCDCDPGDCNDATTGVPIYTHFLTPGKLAKYRIDGKDVFAAELCITGASADEVLDKIATIAYETAQHVSAHGTPHAVYVGLRFNTDLAQAVQSFEMAGGGVYYGAYVSITGTLKPADESLLEGLTLLHRVTV